MSMISSSWVGDLARAGAFLTRLPLPAAEGELASSGWAFPLIGAGLGILTGLAYIIALWLGIPPLPAAFIAVLAGVALTGALHEDGLADTMDGLYGGSDRETRLAIMRDSRSGAYGVLALLFSVSLRAASLAAIGDGGRVMAALIAAHALARAGLPSVLAGYSPARSDGLGAAAGRPLGMIVTWALAIGAVLCLAMLGFSGGLIALVTAGVVMAALAALAQRKIGGYTGDTLGAVEQGGEIVILLVAASWLS